MGFRRDLLLFNTFRPVYEKPYTSPTRVKCTMDSLFPRDSSPRSRPSLGAVIKEKLRGADLVAVGVNIVVGALLIGGVIGALASKDSTGAPPRDLNAAALAAQGESEGNETTTSPAPGADAASDEDDDDEGRKPQK